MTADQCSRKFMCVVTIRKYGPNVHNSFGYKDTVEYYESSTMIDLVNDLEQLHKSVSSINSRLIDDSFKNGSHAYLRWLIDRNTQFIDGSVTIFSSPIYEISNSVDVTLESETAFHTMLAEKYASFSSTIEEKHNIRLTKDKEQRRRVYDQLRKEFEK